MTWRHSSPTVVTGRACEPLPLVLRHCLRRLRDRFGNQELDFRQIGDAGRANHVDLGQLRRIPNEPQSGRAFGLGQGQVWLFARPLLRRGRGHSVLAVPGRWPARRLADHRPGAIMAGILGNLYDRLGLWAAPGMADVDYHAVRDWILFAYRRLALAQLQHRRQPAGVRSDDDRVECPVSAARPQPSANAAAVTVSRRLVAWQPRATSARLSGMNADHSCRASNWPSTWPAKPGKSRSNTSASDTFSVEWKQDASPVTIADRDAEQHLRARIAAAFPADAILGEEFGEQPGSSRLSLDSRPDRRHEVVRFGRAAVWHVDRHRTRAAQHRGRDSHSSFERMRLRSRGARRLVHAQ